MTIPRRLIKMFLFFVLLGYIPLACTKTYDLGPLSTPPLGSTSTFTPIPSSTSIFFTSTFTKTVTPTKTVTSTPTHFVTPTFTPTSICSFIPTPDVACPDPALTLTPIPAPNPCQAATSGRMQMAICDGASNITVKLLWIQSFSGAVTTVPFGLSSDNIISSLNDGITMTLGASIAAIWDGTDQYGNPVVDGCYGAHLSYNDGAGVTGDIVLPIVVNRPLGRVYAVVRDSGNAIVRNLYKLIADPGPSTTITSLNLSAGSFTPSYCAPGPTPSTISVLASNGLALVWDGRNDQGTIVPAGTYSVQLCASNDTSLSNFSGSVMVNPSGETSEASSVFTNPNPQTAGGNVTVDAVSCAGALTLHLSVYDSSNNLITTVTGPAGSSSASFNTTGYSTGVYRIQVGVYDAEGFTGNETVYETIN